jgi:acetyltransferase
MMRAVERVRVPRLGEVVVRPLLRRDDERAYLRFGAALEPDDLRMRFAGPTRWSPSVAERLVARDGTAFAAFDERGEILGVGEVVENEIALAVRSDLKRRGLGRVLLERIVRYGVERGMTELVGTVLVENLPMLALARIIGFRTASFEGTMVLLRLCLP